jgi:GrpB-like predicted nucleotidyltransferase (UPF0157 family)
MNPSNDRPLTVTDEELAAVTIGARPPLNGTIYLAPYDSAWPARFARLAAQIRGALGDKALLLEHVGSTSVPGLSAKPVIDLVLAVADTTDEAAYVPPLERERFVLRIREPAWFEHRLLKAPEVAGNLHVFSAGCEEIDRMLLFRDWLRAHDDDRQLYETTKRDLAARVWRHTQHYADAKAAVVKEILTRAAGSQR